MIIHQQPGPSALCLRPVVQHDFSKTWFDFSVNCDEMSTHMTLVTCVVVGKAPPKRKQVIASMC